MHRPASHHRPSARSLARAVVVGAIAACVVGSAAMAQPPYEPTEHDEQGTYPDQPDDDGWGSGSTDSSTTTTGASVPSQHGTTASTSTWNYDVETDLLKITDRGIDFGDSNWGGGIINDPLGPGSVQWSVDDGYYSAELVGTLHLNGVADQFGRMHIEFRSYGDLIQTRHSATLHATDNGHFERSVDLAPTEVGHITDVVVCTELSDDGTNFDAVSCKTRMLG